MAKGLVDSQVMEVHNGPMTTLTSPSQALRKIVSVTFLLAIFCLSGCSQEKAPKTTAAPNAVPETSATPATGVQADIEQLAIIFKKIDNIAIEVTPEQLAEMDKELKAAGAKIESGQWGSPKAKELATKLYTITESYFEVARKMLPYTKELLPLRDKDPEKFATRRDELKPKLAPLMTDLTRLDTEFKETSLELCREGGLKPFISGAGIRGLKAPPLTVESWHNLPEGKSALNVKDFEGKVLVMLYFQSWCPGCHETGFPLLQQLHQKYRENPNVQMLTVQTVFEGFDTNTTDQGIATLKKFDLVLPMAQDGNAGQSSKLMESYMTGGTPWVVIVDQAGTVRFDGFQIEGANAQEIIDGLLSDK